MPLPNTITRADILAAFDGGTAHRFADWRGHARHDAASRIHVGSLVVEGLHLLGILLQGESRPHPDLPLSPRQTGGHLCLNK
jgi:hypothetical protein